LRHTDWGRLLSIGVPGATTLALVMILETFTATSLMQSRFGVRTDGNRELLVLGGSNLIGALLGGVPSTGSTTRSLFSWLHGGRGLVASLTCLVLTTAMLLALGNWLLAIPACIFAGLFLMQVPQTVDRAFVHSLRTRPSASDLGFWITVAITLVAAFGNLIWACFMGVVLSCLVVLRHVSASLTGQWAYLDVHTSRRVRTAQDAAHLTAHQFQVGVLRLTGNLFFGNSPRLAQLSDEVHADAQITVVDIGQVTHADPSGIDAMVWLVHALVERKMQVILTGAQQCPATVLASTLQAIAGVTSCIDLDRGLECCENQVLAQRSTQHTQHLLVPPQANALLAGLDPGEIASVLALGQARSVAPGAALFCKGAPADGVWLLQVGSVSILAHGGQDSPRLATFGPGQFVGEMGLIDGRPRSATAQADTDVQALLIDNAAIATLVREYPVAALHLTRNIARELSLRLRTLPPH
jgi:SulP family sulfate permease